MITIALVLVFWVLLSIAGWVLLGPLDRARRDALLPVAPLLGVVVMVVVLHDATVLLPVRAGVWLVALVLLVVAGVATRRDRTWWRPGRRALATLALTAACGIVPAVWALGPSLAVGDSNVVQPSDNNDAFYYVTVADWLQDHPATEVPTFGDTPSDPGQVPSYLPAQAQLTLSLRIGQELTHAGLSSLVGTEVDQTWYPLTALWVLLLPAAGVAAARFFRWDLAVGLALGTATSVSTVVAFQLASQNSDSLLGTALVPLALGAVVRALGRDPLLPPALAGVVLTALVGTYTEYLPLIGVALVTAVLVRRPAGIRRALGACLVMLPVALVAAPLVWIRATRSLLFLGSIPSDTYPTAFAGVPLPLVLSRLLGVAAPDAPRSSGLLLVVAGAFVVAGVVAAVVMSGRRAFYVALLAPGAFLAVYTVTVVERPYTQQRVVQLLVPLLLLVVAAGWDAAWRTARQRGAEQQHQHRQHRQHRRRTRASSGPSTVVAGLGLSTAVVLAGANVAVIGSLDLPRVAEQRHVGAEFEEAAAWVREVGGDEGAEVDVLVGDFFSQLWLTDSLRDETEVSYPSLYASYQARSSYDDGTSRRWLVTDRTGIRSVDPDVEVRVNDRFALLDLSRGEAVVAVRADVQGQNSWVLLRSPLGPERLDLVGVERPRAPTDVPVVPGFAPYLDPRRTRPDGTSVVRVDLRAAQSERVYLNGDTEIFDLSALRPLSR